MESVLKLIGLLTFSLGLGLIQSSAVFADCAGDGRSHMIKLRVKSCENIVAEKNPEFQKQMENNVNRNNYKRIYTGALMRDDKDYMWMYPSTAINPCKQFRKDIVVTKTSGRACCDTGAWGKCVFGGAFIWDLNSKPINTFQ
jgi:hypothetical protein